MIHFVIDRSSQYCNCFPLIQSQSFSINSDLTLNNIKSAQNKSYCFFYGYHLRWHVPSRSSLRTLLPPISVAETAFVAGNQGNVVPQHGNGDRPELSEAECDIDSLKKLKLGLRSSLWSRPSTQNNPSSDYSIAV